MSLSQWRLCMFVVYGLVIVHTPFGRAEVVSTPVGGATGAADAPAVIQNPEPKAANNQGPSIPSTGAAGMDSALTLDTELSGIMKECAIFMGNQQPTETSQKEKDEQIEARSGKCRKQRGRLPIEWDPEDAAGSESTSGSTSGTGKVTNSECYDNVKQALDQLEDPVETTVMGCIANCTVARHCNFVTFKPLSDGRGWCTSFHIDARCFASNDNPGCYNKADPGAVGFSLGDCPFAAQPSGDFISQTFGLFRAMRSDAANSLAIAASAITIIAAVAGAPFSFLSKIFKL